MSKVVKLTTTKDREQVSMINADFRTMVIFLEEIQGKIKGKPFETQYAFITPIKRMLYEAWRDTCNPDDPFLNQQNNDPAHL